MNMFLEAIVIALPLTAAAVALLFLTRRHVFRQMDEIVDAAKAGAFNRPFAFRRGPSLPEKDLQPNTLADEAEPHEAETRTPGTLPQLSISNH